MPLARGHILAALGLLVLGVTWFSPLAAAAQTRFSAYMAAHMLVVAVAAPLLVAGWAPLLRKRLRGTGLGLAAGASLFDLVAVWGWHAPLAHQAARAGGWAYAGEQASFLLAGGAVWLAGFAGWASGERGGALTGAAALFFTSMHMTLLGVLIALAGRPLMPGATLADQQLGGVIMLAVGGTVYALGGLILVAVELGRGGANKERMT